MSILTKIQNAITIGQFQANLEFDNKGISNTQYLECQEKINTLIYSECDVVVQDDIYSAYLLSYNINIHLLRTDNWITKSIEKCQTDLETIKNKY